MRDTGAINLADIGFYFGIETLIDFKPKDIPPEVGRVKAEVIIVTYDGSNKAIWNHVEIKTKPCIELAPPDHN